MQELAMAGGRFEAMLERTSSPRASAARASRSRIATHPKQTPDRCRASRLAASLARVALAIQVAASEVGNVPTLVFDEVDTGIGGAVAATVGRMLQIAGRASPGAMRDPSAPGRRAMPTVISASSRPAIAAQRVERACAVCRAARASTSSRGCLRAARSRRRLARTRASCFEQHRAQGRAARHAQRRTRSIVASRVRRDGGLALARRRLDDAWLERAVDALARLRQPRLRLGDDERLTRLEPVLDALRVGDSRVLCRANRAAR